MKPELVKLKESSKIEIISLMDNAVDFLSSSNKKEVKTFWQWNKKRIGLPIAEHGFSMLVRVFYDDQVHSILFDTGVSSNGVILNAQRLGIELNEVSFVVLSHGHYDHFGGLTSVIKAIGKNDLPIIAHKNMIMHRGIAKSNGEIKEYPAFPKIEELTPSRIIYTLEPMLIASELACVTGEIQRIVSFELGLAQNRIYNGDTWQPDPLILDERALVLNVKGRGLVIISGCAHAGIINTIRYAQKITGINEVYAVLGGFHLAGKEYEKRINATLEEIKQLKPKIIVPLHCTGWQAFCALAKSFPDAIVNNSVGNLYQL